MPKKFLVLVLAATALLGCNNSPSLSPSDRLDVPSSSESTRSQQESRLSRVKRTGVLRVGYGGYPPYVVEGDGPGRVSGLAADMITEIMKATDKSIRIEWIPTKFDRLVLDFQTDKYDLVVEPLIQTLPRAWQLGTSNAYTFLGYGIPVVRADNTRIRSLSDIDKEGVVVAVTSTASSHQYAQRSLRKATIRALPAGTLDQPFLEILAGRADVALGDEVTISGFIDKHPGVVRAIAPDTPPERLGAGFLLPQGDSTWGSFLNVGISYVQNTGTLRLLCRKYHVPYYEHVVTRFQE